MSEWTKVEDSLPKEWQTVIAWSADGKNQVKDLMQECKFVGGQFQYGFHNNTMRGVTHWMAFPEPPQKDL